MKKDNYATALETARAVYEAWIMSDEADVLDFGEWLEEETERVKNHDTERREHAS